MLVQQVHNLDMYVLDPARHTCSRTNVICPVRLYLLINSGPFELGHRKIVHCWCCSLDAEAISSVRYHEECLSCHTKDVLV